MATRRPWLVIAVWGVAVLAMGLAGLAAKSVLKPEDLVISGTDSAEQVKRAHEAFGKTTPLMVMLEGPARQLDEHGPKAVRSIERIEGVKVTSPWAPGAPELLRERPGRALLIVDIRRELFDAGKHVIPAVQARLDQALPKSVTTYVAGESRFSTELFELVFSGAAKAEIVALPFLLLILLLIFRAPIAAAIPLAQGLAVIALTSGLVTLLGLLFPVNILAQASGSIIGLALGVDYSLLFVSRFRDELAAGRSVEQAVTTSIQTAGRTVAFAGGILALAGLLVIATTAGWASMTTGSIGVVAAAVFSVLAAFTLLPACLTLVGENINRRPIGKIGGDAVLAPLVRRLIARPATVSLLILIPLLTLCANGLALDTGGPDLKVFDADNSMRSDVEAVAGAYGGGVMAPYQVLVESRTPRPLTAPSDVRAIERFQREFATDPAVRYVIGPGTPRARKLSNAAEQGPARLAYGLSAASIGARKLRAGLGRGARGAAKLAKANSAAAAGARHLQSGLAAAVGGSNALTGGLGKTASGSKQLDAALARLSKGAAQIRAGTAEARRDARSLADSANFLKGRLDEANAGLASVGDPSGDAAGAVSAAIAALDAMPASAKSDPNFQSAYSSLTSAQGSLKSSGSIADARRQYDAVTNAFQIGVDRAYEAANGAEKLADGVNQLSSGLGEVAKHTGTLSSGLSRLYAGSGALSGGLNPLQSGAFALADGLGRLDAGTSELSGGLSSGYRKSRRLSSGLRRIDSALPRSRGARGKSSDGSVDDASLDLAAVGRSAYLTMALLSGAPAEEKKNLQLVLNEERGGRAARIYLFTERFPTDKSIAPFADRLKRASAELARDTGTRVTVGGQGETFLDYDRFAGARIWPLIAAMSLMSFFFLLIVFRSVLLAFKAVVLNTITVGAAMGVIYLLYSGDNPLLGGPGWIEATSFFVVYSTTFALSMDYEIFMIDRMRESYLRTGSNETAIRDGVTKTASIVTGSAAVMSVLFLAMAVTSELVSNAQMGLGLALAITIDATIVRLVLLPASMRLFGQWNWWLPDWLDRVLPHVSLHREPATQPAPA